MEDGEEPGRLHNLARYEISDRVCFRDHIRFRDIFCLDANGKGIARKDLSLFVDDLTSLLVAICRLGKRIHAPFAQGLSRHIRESIAPDARNQLELDDWEWLVEALVQSFEAACDEHKELAISTAQRWRMLWRSEDQSLLGRLYIHAVTRTPELSVNDAIRACLDRPAVLWRYEYEPELLAFLRIRGSDINEDLRNALSGRLLADLLPGLFPEAYSPDDIDRERGQRFAKLRQAGVTLPKRADALAETYFDQNPPSDDPRADEVRYRVVEARWVGPPSGKELAGKKIEEVIDLVDQGRDEYGFKHDEWARAGQIADWLRHDTSRIAETLEVLAERDDVPAGFVDGIIWALRDITNHSEVLTQIDQIASSISRAPSIVDQAFNACAGWIKALAVADISDDVFWQLWDVVRDRAPEEDPSNLLDEKPSLNDAINAAGGHLTEAVIDRFWKSQPRVGQGLPTAVSERLGRIVSGTSRLARHARLVCMPPLDALYAVDPGWSEQHLLKHLSWEDNDEDDVASLWTAHLQHGRWSLDLMAAFKSEFLRVLGKRDRLKHEAYRGACWRFAALGIDRPGFLSDSEVRDGFHRMGAEGAHFVLHLFETRLRQSDEPETQWREMIAPWLEKHWPLLEDLRTTDVFTAAAEMLLETGEAFAEALQTLEGLHLIGVIDRRRLVLFRLAGAENADGGDERFPYASRLPSEVCRWLDRILPRDIPGYEWRYLLTVTDAIERALPPGSGTPPCLHQLRERVH